MIQPRRTRKNAQPRMPMNEPASRLKGAPSGFCNRHIETQQAGGPHRERAQDDKQVEIIGNVLSRRSGQLARSGKLEGKALASEGNCVDERPEEFLQAQVRAEPQEQVEQHRRQDDGDVVGNRIKSRHQ